MRDWIELSDKWTATQFADIDVGNIQPIVDKYARLVSLTSLDPVFKESPVTKLLADKVDTIKSTMPVVTSLRDEHLTKDHWQEIYGIIG